MVHEQGVHSKYFIQEKNMSTLMQHSKSFEHKKDNLEVLIVNFLLRKIKVEVLSFLSY